MTPTAISCPPFKGGSTSESSDWSGRLHSSLRDIELGGDGRWDYLTVDSVGHRLFIARQNRVMAVDPASGKLLGEISGLDGAHGTACWCTRLGGASPPPDGTAG
jgi:hypothetical protein